MISIFYVLILISLLINELPFGLVIETEETCPIDDDFSPYGEILKQQTEILENLKLIESSIRTTKEEIKTLQLLLNEEENKINEIKQFIIKNNIINENEILNSDKDSSISAAPSKSD